MENKLLCDEYKKYKVLTKHYHLLFHFLSTWALVVHIIGYILNFNTFFLALFVLFMSLFLNIHYYKLYGTQFQILKLPYELIFHWFPIFLVKMPNTQEEIDQSKHVLVISILLYMLTFSTLYDEKYVFELYSDPREILVRSINRRR